MTASLNLAASPSWEPSSWHERRSTFDVELNLRDLYDAPTVAAMAETIFQRQRDQEKIERMEVLRAMERLTDDEVEAELNRRAAATGMGVDPI